MNLLIYGPPGAGKSTFGKLISHEYKIPFISTGDILRDHINRHTDIGRKIEGLLSRGSFAPDEIINTIVEERLKKSDCKKGFILDGYPRNISQIFFFSSLLIPLDAVLSLKVSTPVIIKRLQNRAKIEDRPDDKEEVILDRIQTYNKETKPCLLFFEKNGDLVKNIEGDGEITDIFLEIKHILDRIVAGEHLLSKVGKENG